MAKKFFNMGRTGRPWLLGVGLILSLLGFYLGAQGWQTGVYVIGGILACILVYSTVSIAIEEDQTARTLWPELYVQQDADKAIARAKRSSKRRQ